eukprot:scaffold5297_cov104-Cylindrotheca_fusiformis.AAC.3
MSSTAEDDEAKKPIPAWKLRESMRQQGPVPARSSTTTTSSSKKNTVRAPLPPAFKTIRKERLAFAKQQERRKNNDKWVSLNSQHPDDEPPSQHDMNDGQLGEIGDSGYYDDENDDDGSFG